MSQKETNFFNIDAMEQGIARTLVDGITTRIFPGDQAMLSVVRICLLYTSPSPRDATLSRMPSSA